MIDNSYIVYVKIDENNRVTDINSSAFISDVSEWAEIDMGVGDRYHHAQGNYFPKPLTDENGVYRYKYADGIVSERTAEEMAGDIPAPVPEPPTNAELAAAIAELAEVICNG